MSGSSDTPPTAGLKKLNLNAPSFVPNLDAAEFKPSWMLPPDAAAAPAPAPAAAKGPSPAPAKPAQVVRLGSSTPTAATPAPARAPSPARAPATETKPEPKAKAAPSPKLQPTKADATPKPESLASSSSGDKAATPTPELTAEEEEVANEFFSSKDHMNIVFIGHVDAGKSTMGGHILYLTGMVDKRTLEKYEREAKEAGRESWYLSWALDTNKEERAKGKTVEVGRASFETDLRRYTILDAPGHKNYVHNMIGGASQADVAVLVISARRGEFETGFERGGQTQEHAMLVKTNGVNKIVVVINKMDDPTVNWSQERYDECKSKLLPFLKSCGYKPATDIYFLPVSGFTGANLKDPLAPGVFDAYKGPSLLQLLDSLPVDNKLALGPFMMPISDKFKDMGIIVVGKIESGRLKPNQKALILPNKRAVEVTTVYIEDEEVTSAKAGENVQLKLKGVEEEEIAVGSVLTSPEHPISVVSSFEAQLVIIESERIITAGYQAVMHIHNVVEEITITALLHSIDKKTQKRTKKPPMFAKKGHMIIARIECAQPICCDTYKNHAQLGRFTLRQKLITVAMGKITKLCE
ncbi:translation termination factor GTPase eRF3 [Sorochytrium milnesiophthora]